MKNKGGKQSRRSFIKISVTGVAGAALFPKIIKGDKTLKNPRTEQKIIYRTLGRTGLKVPIVSLGVHNAKDMINAALENGINHVDTSAGYTNGNDERALGEVLKEKPRDSFIIGTRFPMWRNTKEQKKIYTPEQMIENLEASLKRLQLDFVDIYSLGGVAFRDVVLHEPFMEVMEKLKKEGKTRFIGVAAHFNEPEVLRAAIESKIYDVAMISYHFRKKNRNEIKKAFAEASKAGIGIIAMKTQAGVYWDKERKQMINMKAALKWALRDENVHCAVPGMNSIEEMKVSLSVMEDLKLTPEEIKDLKLGDEMGYNGLYCEHCEKCLAQCKGDFDIPTLMRSYMYAYGYESPAKARDALEHIDFSQVICEDCPECTVKCTMGFNVKEKVLDIARIMDVPGEFLA